MKAEQACFTHQDMRDIFDREASFLSEREKSLDQAMKDYMQRGMLFKNIKYKEKGMVTFFW